MSKDKLELYAFFGLTVREELTTQYKCDCPFCGKENHFFVNRENGLWDCKAGHCGLEGNHITFLQELYNVAEKQTKESSLRLLAKNKTIPYATLKRYGVVKWGDIYLIPIYGSTGNICNFRYYRIGQKVKGPPILGTFPLNLYKTKGNKKQIIICGGEWDTMSLDFLLRQNNDDAIPVGLPGEKVFKKEWIQYFHNRDVIIALDHDYTGNGIKGVNGKGKEKLIINLSPFVNSLHYVNWPDTLKEGYDLKDHITEGILDVPKQDLGTFLQKRYELLNEYTEEINTKTTIKPSTAVVVRDRNNPFPKFERVIDEYSKYLKINDNTVNAIKIALAVGLSTQIPGPDPAWVYLEGPPGCGKSTIIESMKDATSCLFQSTLRKTALISGWNNDPENDPSIIPQLNGRCLALKDMTELLKKHPIERDEVFAVLRGAFDGYCEIIYATGLKRYYESSFAIIAGVTKEIRAYSTASMGERFLRFSMNHGETNAKELNDIASSAMDAALFGGENRLAVRSIVKQVLDYDLALSAENLREILGNDWDSWKQKIIALANIIASLRTVVSRHEKGRLQYEPIYQQETESPARVSVQLQRIFLCLAILNGKIISEADYALLQNITRDSVDLFTYKIVETLYNLNKPITYQELAKHTKLSATQITAYCDDLCCLNLLQKKQKASGESKLIQYELSPTLKSNWEIAGL